MFLGVILFFMVQKMTEPIDDAFYDPVLKRNVPFFVYMANCKLVLLHMEKKSQYSSRSADKLKKAIAVSKTSRSSEGNSIPSKRHARPSSQDFS